MGSFPVLRSMASLLVGLLLAACANSTSVTTAGSLDPGVATTLSTATTDSLVGTTNPGQEEEATTPASLVASFDDIAGTYVAKDPSGEGFLRILGDGTLHWAPNEDSPQIVLNAKFEGTSVVITDHDCDESIEGVYEFRLSESGDLAVALVGDECAGRAGAVPGEYTPID